VAAACNLLAEYIGEMNNAELILNTASLLALNTALQSADHPVLEDLLAAVEAAITVCQAETVGRSFRQGPDASPPKPLSEQGYASLHLRVPLRLLSPGRQAQQPAGLHDDTEMPVFDDDEGFMDEDRHNDIDEPMADERNVDQAAAEPNVDQAAAEPNVDQAAAEPNVDQAAAEPNVAKAAAGKDLGIIGAPGKQRFPPHMAANAHHALMRPTGLSISQTNHHAHLCKVNKVSAWCREPIELCSLCLKRVRDRGNNKRGAQASLACCLGGGKSCRQRAFLALSEEDRKKVLEILKKFVKELDGMHVHQNRRAMSEQLIGVRLANQDDQKVVTSSILPHMLIATDAWCRNEVQGYPDVDPDLLVSTCTLALRLRAQWDSSDEGQKLRRGKEELLAAHAAIAEFCSPARQHATSTKPSNPDPEIDDGSVSATGHGAADGGGSAECGGSAGPCNTSAKQGGTAGQGWAQQGPGAGTFCNDNDEDRGHYHQLDYKKRVRECLYCKAVDLTGRHMIGSTRCKKAWPGWKLEPKSKPKSKPESKPKAEPNYGSDRGKLVQSCRYCGFESSRGQQHTIGSRRCIALARNVKGSRKCRAEATQEESAAKAPASNLPPAKCCPICWQRPNPNPKFADSGGCDGVWSTCCRVRDAMCRRMCEEQAFSLRASLPSQSDATSISSLPVFSSEDAQLAFLRSIGQLGPSSAPALLICGPPGTGKSFITQRLVSVLRIVLKSDKAVALTAPTGLLAMDIGGVTLHSWAGIGTAKQLDSGVLYDQMSAAAKQRWIEARVLVLDDASLIAAELFDCLESLARKVRSQPDHFFGGLFIVLQFDLGQLHPVKCRCDSCRMYGGAAGGGWGGSSDQKCDNKDPGRRTPLYKSAWWEGFLHDGENAPLCVSLSTQWRFGGCAALQGLIGSLRGHSSKTPMREKDHQLLEKSQFSAPSVPKAIVLCPRNEMVGPRSYAPSLPLSLSHCRCHTLRPCT